MRKFCFFLPLVLLGSSCDSPTATSSEIVYISSGGVASLTPSEKSTEVLLKTVSGELVNFQVDKKIRYLDCGLTRNCFGLDSEGYIVGFGFPSKSIPNNVITTYNPPQMKSKLTGEVLGWTSADNYSYALMSSGKVIITYPDRLHVKVVNVPNWSVGIRSASIKAVLGSEEETRIIIAGFLDDVIWSSTLN